MVECEYNIVAVTRRFIFYTFLPTDYFQLDNIFKKILRKLQAFKNDDNLTESTQKPLKKN